MKKCLIIPYYGIWPKYFDIFLKGYEYNRNFDIIFFTDLIPPDNTNNGIHFIKMNLEGIEKLILSETGIEFKLKNPYKLCDFKPLYGKIFGKYLENYDFWGFGDIDLIYGAFSEFDIDSIAEKSDVILFRKRWVSGSLSFFKNNETINNLYLKAENYKDILANPKHMAFDEVSKAWDEIKIKDVSEINFKYDNFTNVVFKEERNNTINVFRQDLIKESIRPSGFVIFDRGRVFDQSGKEYLYYHYISEKGSPFFRFPNWKKVPDKFYITKSGFFTEQEFKYRSLSTLINGLRCLPNYFISILKRIRKKLLA